MNNNRNIHSNSIIEINNNHIKYIYDDKLYIIDLNKCAENLTSLLELQCGNSNYVGYRGKNNSMYWVKFQNNCNTSFEFDSFELLCSTLIGPLRKVGWRVLDTA